MSIKSLNLIKKINLIKKNDSINTVSNIDSKYYDIDYKNTLEIKEYLNLNLFKLLTYMGDNIIFFLKKNQNNNNFIKLFYNFMYILSNINRFDFIFHKNNIDSFINHSSYDLNIISSLTLKEANKKMKSIFNKNKNKYSILRRYFKHVKLKTINKTSIIDLVLKKFIEKHTANKVSMNFDKYSLSFFKKKTLYLKIIRRKLRRMKKMLKWASLSVRNFIRISLIFLCTKDIEIFAKALIKIMNSMHYKNHRRFLYYFKLFITKSMNYYFSALKFEGFYFYLSGKISGGGNSKKKNYVVKSGKYSLTNKMLKLKYKKGLIHTKTGVLGYKFIISYN